MNKLLMIGVVVLLVLGGGYWYMTRSGGNLPGTPQNIATEFSGNLMEAMSKNVPMKCTWTSGADSGEVLVKGEMMHATMMNDGKTSYVVRSGGCNYMWGEGMEQAIKICMELDASDLPSASGYTAPTTGEAQYQGPDLNVDYRCLPPVVSDDKFDPPTNIQFTDMGEMMNKMMENLPSAPAMPNYDY